MRCVYCGKEYDAGGTTVNVSNGVFDVCSSDCRKKVIDYLNRDKEYKNRMYVLVFSGSIGFFLSTFLFSGTYKLLPMYLGMIIMGVTLIIYPYIFSSFLTFTRYPIVKATRMVKVIGFLVVLTALVFIVLTYLVKVI